MTRIYLDHAATSPLRPEARAAMEEGFAIWANPSSPHAEGRRARAALEDARERVKAALGWNGEVIFTSGASEAADRAFAYSDTLFQFASSVEHDSILHFANFNDCEEIPVGTNGAVRQAQLSKLVPIPKMDSFQPGKSLIAIQHVNSESGNMQDIDGISAIVRERDGHLLVDCAQSAGKFPIPESADMVIMSAHKFGGPIGVGALLIRDYALLKPSGGQERGYRRGTENLPGVLGMVAALEAGGEPYLKWDSTKATDRLAERVRAAGGEWLGDRLDMPTSYIHAIAMPGLSATAQVMRFDMMGISVSQGSACSSGTMKSSAVLAAMGVEQSVAERTIRVSLGWNTTEAEIDAFADAWVNMAESAQ